MKIFGSIQELVELVYRKGSNTVTLKPNTAQATNVTVSLPLLTGNDTVVTDTSTSTLSNKSVSGDTNTLSNIAITSLKTVLTDANKVILRDGSGAVTSASITNTNVDAAAAIALTKLATVTASRALQSDGSGNISASSITSTELGHLSGVSSNIQTQLNGKEATITILPVSKGGTNSSTSLNNNRVMISSGSAIVEASAITASRALASDASGLPVASATTSTELGYVSGVTSAIQTQINAKADSSALTAHTGASSGVHGVTGSVVGTSDTQILTNKDIAGGTASNTSRITLPSAAKSTLDGLTRKQATLVYGTDTNKVYADDGSSLKEIGSGSSGINYLSSQYGADSLGTVELNVGNTLSSSTRSSPTQWGNSAATALITQSTDSTLRGTTNYLVQYSANAQFVESPLFSIDGEDLGKPLLVQFDVSGVSTADDVQVYIARYDSSNVLQERILVAGTASATTPNSAQVPTAVTTFKGFFIPSSTAGDKYAVRWLRNANNTSMRLDTFFVGPQSLAQGAVVTAWQSYTPTLTSSGGGNITLNATSKVDPVGKWRRVGDSIEIFAGFRNGSGGAASGTAGSVQIGIPSGITIDTTNLGSFNIPIGFGGYATGSGYADTQPAFYVVSGNSIRMIKGGSASYYQVSDLISSTNMTFVVTLPVVEWASSTTTLADRAVEEYAWNSSTADSSDTTSFGYGVDGVALGAFTAARTKRVRFTTPIQPTDVIILEYKRDSSPNWQSVSPRFTRYKNTNDYGIESGIVNSTDVDVFFQDYADNLGAGNRRWDPAALGTGFKWRVRKVSGGATVGFPVEYSNLTMQGQGNGMFYQSEAATLTFTGFSTATTLSVTITRIGNVVTMLIPAIGAKTKDATVNLTATGIPTWARPAAALNGLGLYEATNTFSGITIGTTGGLQAYRTSSFNNWVASTAYNFTTATSLTWIV